MKMVAIVSSNASMLKECWRALNLEDVRINLCERTSVQEVSEHILGLPENKSLLIICFLWSWWDARNKANVGEQRRSVTDIIHRARSVLFAVETEEDRDCWLTAFKRVIPESTEVRGWMYKTGAANPGWKRRHFVLHQNGLAYYEDEDCKLLTSGAHSKVSFGE